MKKDGNVIVWILDKIENDHAIKSIDKMTIFVKKN